MSQNNHNNRLFKPKSDLNSIASSQFTKDGNPSIRKWFIQADGPSRSLQPEIKP